MTRYVTRPRSRISAGKGALLSGLTIAQLLLVGCSVEPAQAPDQQSQVAADRYVAHRDPEAGAPTFVWLDQQPQQGDATTVAFRVLRSLAGTYGMDEDALAAARLVDLHDIGQGAIIARFEQQVDGLEVFRHNLNIALTRDMRPVAATGYLAAHGKASDGEFALDADAAVARAIREMTGAETTPKSLPKGQSKYDTHAVPSFAVAGQRYTAATPPRSKRVWFVQGGVLVPAYYVELDLSVGDQPDSELRSYVIAARDGAVLFQNELTAGDSYTYRVWADKAPSFQPWDGPHGNEFTPHPTGKKDGTSLTFVPSQLVTAESTGFSMKDPWLPPMAMEARGNNAVAYADIASPDGFGTGDVMLKPSMPGTFDYALSIPGDDPAKDDASKQAVTTNFFYIVNYLHDTFYDAGWDEKSRNPQMSNFGRGGVEKDPIRAEAQDYTGRNNANASTPADGSSPRIQMYLFDPQEDALRVTMPADLAKTLTVGKASFGAQKYDITAEVVPVNDGMGMSPSDGCDTPFVNAMAIKDKIALVDRGNCFFEEKAYKAQVNGAKAVIIVNNVPDAPGGMAPAPTPPPMPVTIPALMIPQADGNAIRAKITGGTAVTASFKATVSNNDSSLDGHIVTHEWGHVLSNRLIGNANGLSNNQGRSMGEGWSDFVALLATTRPEDAMNKANADWKGAFAAAAYSLGPSGNSAYDGIRRYPYSIDMAKNPLMFRHIANGTPLPMTPAPAFGQTGSSNAEVHNSGEVWSNMLWECYVALLKDTTRYTFAQATKAMREYLVASLKLTPNAPTMVEARDAVLAAALAKNQKDFELFAQAFARRGMGVGAVAPPRSSSSHTPVKESTAYGGAIEIESITLSDVVRSCDKDGILDNRERGYLTVKIRNTGWVPLSPRARVTADSSTLSFPRGAQFGFPTVQPYQSATGRVEVALDGAAPITALALRLSIDASGLAQPGPVVSNDAFTVNYNLEQAASTDDAMDDPGPGWTAAGDSKLDTQGPWRHVRSGTGGTWSIPDAPLASDQWLVTPALQVGSSAFGFTLSHRYSFEADSFTFYDGGVIELSTDDGMTWTDIATAFKSNGYNATLWSLNAPLKSRRAFSGNSSGYPGFVTTTVDFGTTYAGKTIKLRFRVGTDSDVGAAGWDLDQISFSGLTNTPFPLRQANSASCPLLPTP